MNLAIEIRKLCVTYGRHGRGQLNQPAVNNLTLVVRPGEVFGFLGPNGVGKTTSMNVLLGFMPATEGIVRLFDVDARHSVARQRIGYLPEMTYCCKFMTEEELLCFYARIFRIPRAERSRRIAGVLTLVGLEQAGWRQIKTYSKGMQQRIGLAQAQSFSTC
ncbi:MAG: ABC transporter ATP-binding protein [Kiritimatiellae bacterium]|nr:ABC transporter ATP-binding protein [Kiritimatiellia bacterium]